MKQKPASTAPNLGSVTRGWTPLGDGSYLTPQGTVMYVQPQYRTDGPSGEAGYDATPYQFGTMVYDKNYKLGESMADWYDPQGNFSHQNLMTVDDYKKNAAMFAAAAGGMMMLPGGLLASGAGGAGAGATGAVDMGTATGADLSTFYGGDSLGGLGGFGGTEAGLGAGVNLGTGTGADLSAFYGGTDGGASLGGLGGAVGPAGGGGSSGLSGLLGDKGLGLATTALGAMAGSQGQQGSKTATAALDPRLDAAVYGSLIPAAQGLLSTQMPAAAAAGGQMATQGAGLLAAPVAGNGYGKVTLNAPTTATNPYLSGMADDIQRRVNDATGQSLLSIQGNSVASGGLGGSRQGVAQGAALKGAADSLAGNLSNLYGTQYSQDQNRALQQYGLDMGFYGQQRAQDLQSKGLGADLTKAGFDMQWSPIKNATSAYSPFTGYGSQTTSVDSGGGWMGALGGGLGAAQLAQNFGLWGNKGSK